MKAYTQDCEDLFFVCPTQLQEDLTFLEGYEKCKYQLISSI